MVQVCLSLEVFTCGAIQQWCVNMMWTCLYAHVFLRLSFVCRGNVLAKRCAPSLFHLQRFHGHQIWWLHCRLGWPSFRWRCLHGVTSTAGGRWQATSADGGISVSKSKRPKMCPIWLQVAQEGLFTIDPLFGRPCLSECNLCRGLYRGISVYLSYFYHISKSDHICPKSWHFSALEFCLVEGCSCLTPWRITRGSSHRVPPLQAQSADGLSNPRADGIFQIQPIWWTEVGSLKVEM